MSKTLGPLARIAGAVVLTGALLLGCSSSSTSTASSTSSSPSSSPSGSAAGQAPALTIMSFRFVPNPLNVAVGDTITVTNVDNTDHTVTADDHSFDTGRFSSGSKTFVVRSAGTITFHCAVHTYMTGVIHVAPR